MLSNRNKGTVTIEGALTLPLFTALLLSVALFLRAVYIYEVVQDAMSKTVAEISVCEYILDKNEPKTDEFFTSILHLAEKPVINLVAREIFVANIHKRAGSPIEKIIKDMTFVYREDKGVFSLGVNYEIPVGIFPKLKICQRAMGRVWRDGGDDTAATEDIWSLDNLSRGKRIRDLFGANLPFNFPVIASFYGSSGKAVMIKSMDTTAPSYENTQNMVKKIQTYINQMDDYDGQNIPWGSEGIVINSHEIISKQLLLVIPENEIGAEKEGAFTNLIRDALLKGITLKVERYGYKKGEKPD